MLLKSDGPSSMKKIKLPAIKRDILQLAESNTMDNEETQTLQTSDETVETTASNDSMIFASYESSLDLGYASIEGNIPQDTQTENDTNGLAEIDPNNDLFETDSFGAEGNGEAYDYGTILSQFDTFFRGKLDAELALFQDSMHSMLTEQQIHLRKIISSTSQENAFEVATDEASKEIDSLTQERREKTTEECGFICQEAGKKTKNKVVIELLSLSCQLTQLLGQQKFQSCSCGSESVISGSFR